MKRTTLVLAAGFVVISRNCAARADAACASHRRILARPGHGVRKLAGMVGQRSRRKGEGAAGHRQVESGRRRTGSRR